MSSTLTTNKITMLIKFLVFPQDQHHNNTLHRTQGKYIEGFGVKKEKHKEFSHK